MRQAQDGDPDDPFTRALRGTYNDLEAEWHAALSAVAMLDAADDAAPARPDTAGRPVGRASLPHGEPV